MDHYVATKARLFKHELHKLCILPRDCEYFDVFARAAQDYITYSMQQPANYQTRALKADGEGIDITIKSATPISEEARIVSKLV